MVKNWIRMYCMQSVVIWLMEFFSTAIRTKFFFGQNNKKKRSDSIICLDWIVVIWKAHSAIWQHSNTGYCSKRTSSQHSKWLYWLYCFLFTFKYSTVNSSFISMGGLMMQEIRLEQTLLVSRIRSALHVLFIKKNQCAKLWYVTTEKRPNWSPWLKWTAWASV